jgi:hypothetical protein
MESPNTPATPELGTQNDGQQLNLFGRPDPNGVTTRMKQRDAVEQKIVNEAKEKQEAREAEAAAEEQKEADRKAGLSWEEAVNEAPPHIAELMKNMRADYTRKTQQLSKDRKALAAEKEALLSSGALDKLREAADADAGELNPFDESSIQARIEKEVARRLAEALAPIEQEHQKAQARQNYESFLDQHPDLKTDETVRGEVYKALQDNPNLDLASAYYAVKGRILTQQQAHAEERRRAEQKAARAAALTATGRGSKVGPPTLSKEDTKGKNAWEIYQQLKRQAGR